MGVSKPPGTFADRLRALRQQAALSQYALAKRSGLSKQALSQLERGESSPTWETVQLLAAVLGVTCQEFVDQNLKPPAEVPSRPLGRPRKGGKGESAPPQDRPKAKKPRGRRGGRNAN
jgi:transcriptional regulator with XRE-family HTH domain